MRSISWATVFISVFTSQVSFAQMAKVLVQNAKSSTASNPVIEIKWYSSSLVYPNGCNIYRRLTGETTWVKINASPVTISKIVPLELSKEDESLEALVSMASEIGKSKSNGFLLLNLFTKSFRSSQFSKLIGIQFDDTKNSWGSSYQYRITTLERGQESELAISPSIQAGPYVAAQSVQEFTARLDKKTVKLNWKPDESMFFGVNVYRASDADTTWKKLNKNPIVLSEARGNPSAAQTLYIDTELKEGANYFYRISGLDFFGNESLPTKKIQIQVGDITPPPAPINPIAKVVKEMNVRISWTPVTAEDLAAHAIYRSNKSDGHYERINVRIIPKTDSVYEDTGLLPEHYYYYVSSVDKSGNEKASEITLVEVKDITPPAVPTQVSARPDTGKIILSWAKNKEADLVGYYVYRSIQVKENTEASFVLVNAKPFKDSIYVQVLPKNVANPFLFKIVAVDTAYNKSAFSEIVSAKMPDVIPPIKPIIKQILIKGDSIHVSWKSNPEQDVAGYNLYRYTNSTEKTKVNTRILSPRSTSFVDIDSAVVAKIYFELQAIDESGNISPFSDPFPVDKQEKFGYQFLNASAKFNRRKKVSIIKWSGTSSEKNLIGFVVYRKQRNSPWKPASNLQTATELEDRQVSSKNYLYRIKAFSSRGATVWSEVLELKSKEVK